MQELHVCDNDPARIRVSDFLIRLSEELRELSKHSEAMQVDFSPLIDNGAAQEICVVRAMQALDSMSQVLVSLAQMSSSAASGLPEDFQLRLQDVASGVGLESLVDRMNGASDPELSLSAVSGDIDLF